MKTEIENISSVKKKLKVEVLSDIVNQARLLAIQEIQKKAKVEGFRPGKVPPQIIQQRFSHELQHETIEKIVDQTLIQAFRDAKVRPISRPEIAPGLWDAAGGFSYTATFEILPEIQLKEYKGLKLEKTQIEVHTSEVEEELKRLQQAMTQLEPTPTETALGKDHVAFVDFKGLLEGKTFQGGESQDFHVEIGTGNVLQDFEEGLKGAKAGEERQVSFTYPQDYFNKELAGKKADFKIKVKEIRKKNVPALDDEFAKDLGDFKDLKAVREDLEKRIAQTKEAGQKGELYAQIVKQLVEKNSFEVPESLVSSELAHMLGELAEELKKRGQKLEELNMEEVVKTYKPEAETHVQGFLLLDKIAQAEKIEVLGEEVSNRLDSISKRLNRPLPEIKAYYEKQDLISSLQARILHEKALEFVLNMAKIKSVKAKKKEK